VSLLIQAAHLTHGELNFFVELSLELYVAVEVIDVKDSKLQYNPPQCITLLAHAPIWRILTGVNITYQGKYI
jgi:hypothetical protein